MTDDSHAQDDRLHWHSTALVVVVLGCIAAWSLPRAIQAGDAGEFATVMLGGGVPHPSGYPWMRMLGVFSRGLFALGVPPAASAAIPCAALSIGGFAFMHRVALWCTRPASTRARAVIATCVTLLFACSSPVVLHTMDTEVWGPLVFAAGLFSWLAIVRRASPFVVGIALGLAVSHHLTAVMLVPLAVASAWPKQTGWSPVLRAGLQGISGSLLGLAALLTLMLGAHGLDAAWAWGDTQTWAGWLHHITRGDYGVFQLSLQEQRPPAWAQLRRALDVQGGALTARLSPHWVLSGLALLIPWVLAIRRGVIATRLRVGLVLSAVLSGVLFPLAHNLDPTAPPSMWILERFDVLPIALNVPIVALALAPVPAAVADRGRAGVGLAICGLLLVLRQLVFTAWHGVASDNPWVEDYARDVLATPTAKRAIVVGTDDHRTFPLLYAQTIRGEGANVLYIDASLLAHPWYRARLRDQEPALPDIDKPVRLLTTLQADPSWDAVDLYLTNDFSVHSAGLPRVPEGLLWRLVHPRLPPPTSRDVLRRHVDALAKYGPVSREAFYSGHPFAADLVAQYLSTTASLAQALEAEGHEATAEALLRFGMQPNAAPRPSL